MPTPCQRGNPDDWFVDPRPSRQQPGEAILRRKALEACWNDCASRLACLDLGLRPENLEHGIWGGYTESQRQQIHNEREKRRKT